MDAPTAPPVPPAPTLSALLRRLAAERAGEEALVYPAFAHGGQEIRLDFAALDARWKLAWFSQAPPRLYDLEADPAEQRNEASSDPGRVETLRAEITPWLDAVRELGFQDTGRLAPQDLEVLKALGYVE